MAGKSLNSFGAKNWAPNSPATRYNVSGKNREFYTFENAPGAGAYATGGTIIDGGDGYIYHVFTGTGDFTVNTPPAAINSVDYMVVAGGGGGGTSPVGGGGGGGGGMLFGSVSIPGPGPNPIVVGGGGPNTGSPGPAGIPGSSRTGSNSSAFGFVASGGGGGGGPPSGAGGSGGSGGGGGPNNGALGAGNPPPGIPRQGYPGANGGIPGQNPSGGGGGAGGLGGAGSAPTIGGSGGPGRIDPNFPASIIAKAIPSPVLPAWSPLVSTGGYAAGGNGGPANPSPKSAPLYSGYGGQGTAPNQSAGGGSGIVCIRYKKNVPYTRATGGIVEPSTDPTNGHPGVWRHIFTQPGTFEVIDPSLTFVDYLAIGGGGAGGADTGGGGGGGGFVSSIHTSTTTPTAIPEAYPWNPRYSVRVGEQMPVGPAPITSPISYPVVIGAGGSTTPGQGNPGENTIIGSPGPNGSTTPSQIIAYGGGGGGSADNTAPYVPLPGLNGGSGGGGSKSILQSGPISGGTATPSPLIQGNPGGNTIGGSTISSGAGGGGAGAPGSISSGGGGPYIGGPGGVGWYSVLSPPTYGTPGPLPYRYFAGGGGGAGGVGPGGSGAGAGGAGGAGGGGDGKPNLPSPVGTAGTANTGGGGGAGYAGGSGIVIIQYPE